ncbi:VOC family protein [Phenylobacterium sp.]|uniref:VOC family protein n=1 Tax=Phenylobacterium sp. TaxID=1871053 RepID=UPI00121EAAE0|nr:VOC family protein [Phenylobacterium sp.]TAL28454.1 MAG: VOC family protein [Phenylobacterium sp.]
MDSHRDTPGFRFRGVNHIALVCRDMARTVAFYRDALGMPLVKTLELPDGKGQHFFFDAGGGASIAFFWFPAAPEAQPGVVQAPLGGGPSAHGSMNHLALDVAPEDLTDYRDRLIAAGIDVTDVVAHRDPAPLVGDDPTFIRSIYFHDPDGIRLEFAAWARDLTPLDVSHAPRSTAPQGF